MIVKENKKKITKEEEAALIALGMAKMREGLPDCIRIVIEQTRQAIINTEAAARKS